MHVAKPEDWVVILSVLGSVTALYLSAAFIIFRRFILPHSPKLGAIGCVVLLLAAGGLGCLVYAGLVEPNNLQITRIRVPIHELPANTKPIYLVHISDTHCDSTIRLEDKVVAEIAKIKPSLIFFTGDAVNSLEGVPIFDAFAKKLLDIAPTMAVKGDWDFAFAPHDVLTASGLDVISGYRIVTVDGVKLCIVGANSAASCRDVLKNAPVGLPTIFLYHNPDGDIVLNHDTGNVGLYLCGHTHGGQIALPFYGALITQSVQGKKYESGLHSVGSMFLYTNRGIGMEGHFPRLRFCAPPELTVIELYKGS